MKLSVTGSLAVLTWVLSTAAFPTNLAGRYDLGQIFNVDFSDKDHGACGGPDNHQQTVETSYAEAIQAIIKTLAALEWLSELKLEPTKGGQHEKYLKITQAFVPLFGAEAWTEDCGLSQIGKAVQDVYQAYLENHDVSKLPSKEPRYYLRCDDYWLKYLKPTDLDPREKGKPDAAQWTVAKPRTGLPFPRGALYDKAGLPPGLPKGADLIQIDTQPKRADSPYCNDRTRAVSNRPNKLLILCYKSTMPAPMKPRPEFPKEVTLGKLLDDVTDWALPTTWIHEMGHYVMGWPEPKVQEGGMSHDVYSWDLTTTLAKTNKEQSLQSPEAFALFATTMWFDQWYWGSGAAKAKPGHERTPPASPAEPAFQDPNDPFKTPAKPPKL